jgi:hypothetical protein
MRFDEGRHIYRSSVDGGKFRWSPGATSISGFMDNGKCEGLKRWALKMGLAYMAEQLEAGRSYDEIELAEMLEAARTEPFKRTKAAADIGNVTHKFVEHWYSGTVDIIAEVNGQLTVGDLKTSNYLSAEHLLQAAGYQIALEEEFEDPFENRVILHLDKLGGDIKVYDLNALAGTQIKMTPWMKINFHTYEEDKATFLGLRTAYRGVRNG